jgi:ABC-type cobalamin/Fe3+-siderophores transport system ATPase subunit
MHLLTDKYRPTRISDFVGLDKPKTICSKLAAKPFASAWRFVGPTGVGKTTLALALAEQMPAELHHIPSQDCNIETLRRVIGNCHYVPRAGYKMHLVLIDEADQMTAAAQLYLLSKLDGTAFPPNTIFIFTMNSTEGLEKRFLDRTVEVWFSSKGIAPDATSFIEFVWQLEAGETAAAPNFARIVKEANNSIRGALMELQNELMLLA